MGVEKAQLSDEPIDWSAVALAPLLVAIALWSVPNAIQAGDAGEFATVMLTGGVPHPSGYPWMRVLGLFSRGLWTLGLPPATAAALPPALCGVVGWLLIHRCCAQLGHRVIGAVVVGLCASSGLVVLHVNDSEVWGPHSLFCALFLHAVIDTRDRPRPFRLGLCLGLAVSHHLTAVLLVPLAIGAALPRGAWRDRNWGAISKHGALGVGGSAAGLLPYATVAIGRGGGWRWGEVETAPGLLHHVLRRDYGTFSLSLHDEQVAATDAIARALASVGEVASVGLASAAWVGAVALAAILTMAGLWLRETRRLDAKLAIGWALALLASAVGFPALHDIDPTSPFGAWILERFDLLTILLLAVPATLAAAWLAARIEAGLRERPRFAILAAVATALVLELAQVGSVLERGRPASEGAVELAAIDLVETPSPAGPAPADQTIRAIVIGTDDHRSFPVLYVQEVLGAGAHTLYIDAQLLAHPWYRARLRARMPELPDVDKPLKLMAAIWSDPALASTPIYLANVFSRPAAGLAKVPEGLLWRVPPPPELASFAASDWTPEAVADRHLEACARMRVRARDFAPGRAHPRGHPWSPDLRFAYVDKARRLAAGLMASGAAIGDDDRVAQILAALERTTGAEL